MHRAAEQHAAKMRLRNAEERRKELWRKTDRQFKAGKLTAREVFQQRAEFWDQVRADKKLAYPANG